MAAAKAFRPTFTRLLAAIQRAARWWNSTRLGRTISRYSAANGGLLAGGIAYAALFSLVAVFTIALTVFAALLGGHPALDRQIDKQLASWFPGVLTSTDGSLAGPSSWVRPGALSLTSVIAAVVLVWSALSAMSAVQTGVRAMFELAPRQGGPAWLRRIWALAGFGLLGIGLLASSVVAVAAASAGEWAAKVFGSPEAATVLRWAGSGVSVLVDAVCIALVFTVVAGARPPWRDLVIGAGAAAVAMGLLKHLGTRVVAHATANAFLASATTVVTLLVWVNLMSRVVLYAAAWTAVGRTQISRVRRVDRAGRAEPGGSKTVRRNRTAD
jgi:membrane protein